MTLINTKKAVPLETSYEMALATKEKLQEEVSELKRENDILLEENLEYEQIVSDSYHNEDSLRDALHERDKILKMDQGGRKILPYACFATAAALTMGAYILLTDTPLKDKLETWLNSYHPGQTETQNSH